MSFGIVSAQSQGSLNLLLRQSLAQTQKSSLRTATVFLYTLRNQEGFPDDASGSFPFTELTVRSAGSQEFTLFETPQVL